MTDGRFYQEIITSKRTQALFLVLTLLFLSLFAWRAVASGMGFLAVVFLCFFAFFLFYSLNYRTLIIHLTPEALKLRFGIFTWTVPLQNIESCNVDVVPLLRIGGAGIHFTSIERRYRVMFNFLEYPRLVIQLKEKRGLVRDVVFSTKHPEEIERFIQEALWGEGIAR
jgi:Ca2+/Na+ antiporter